MTPPTVLLSRLLTKARLRHIQVFVKLAELGSINRAAHLVGLSQPSASQAIADLEALLECRLFERHARGVRLTEVGKALQPMARKILESLGTSADVVFGMNQQAQSCVRVGTITSAVTGVLAPALPSFVEAHPDVLVHVREGEVEQVATWVSGHEVDLVLWRCPQAIPEEWTFTPVQEDVFVVLAGAQHPLARREQVGIEDLNRFQWLQMPVSSAPHRALDVLITRFGLTPRFCGVNTRSMGVYWAMLRQAPLLTLQPLSYATLLIQTGEICRLNVSIPVDFEPIGIMHPVLERGSAAQRLNDHLLKHARNQQAPEDR